MAEFLPFRGTRYSNQLSLKDIVAPPYDVISPEQRDVYYEKDEHNVIRLELNRDSDPYTSAKNFFDAWKEENALVTDDTPAYYVYYQLFKTPTGELVTRAGVLGRLKLTPYSDGQVLPHERTLAGPKRDRLKLLETVKTNLSPIFGLISDPTQVFEHMLDVARAYPVVADVDELLANGETIRHIMWKLTESTAVDRIKAIVSAQPVIIADGHHRYETSLAFSQSHPEIPGADHILIFIANLHGDGTVILPTHRMLYGIPDFNQYTFIEKLRQQFDLVFFSTRDEGLALLERSSNAITLIELAEDPKWVLVLSRDDAGLTPLQKLAPYRLQENILKPFAGLTQEAIDNKSNLLYPHTVAEADEMADTREINATFFLKPVTPAEMGDVVTSGEFMPQKSTFFYPKLLTGLVFHEFAEQA